MGGLLTSAEDYARYVAFLLSAWPPRDDAEAGPVRRATVRELGVAHGFPLPPPRAKSGGKTLAIASAYGYGMVSSLDPVLGRTIHHRGGLPGYGSHVLISPDTGIGLFTFANVTYADADPTNVDAALALHQAGLWKAATAPRHAGLGRGGRVSRCAPTRPASSTNMRRCWP
jgi:CubicO group peptidase (beta-lactamase class C family)